MPTYNQLIKQGRKSKKRVNRIAALDGCPQKKGVCIKVYTTKPKKPHSAIRKIAKVRLLGNYKNIIAYIPGEGHNLQQYSIVLIKAGRVRDLPGVKYKILRGKFDCVYPQFRRTRRSLYGVKKRTDIKPVIIKH